MLFCSSSATFKPLFMFRKNAEELWTMGFAHKQSTPFPVEFKQDN